MENKAGDNHHRRDDVENDECGGADADCTAIWINGLADGLSNDAELH
jgi:hypothetical protein